MNAIISTITLGIGVIAAPLCSISVANAQSANQEKVWEEYSLDELYSMLAKDNSGAMTELGGRYFLAIGVEQDIEKAVELLTLSAGQEIACLHDRLRLIVANDISLHH